MRGLIWLLALFALAVGVAVAFSYNEGYALLVLPPWRVELSLNMVVVLLVLVFLLLYGVLRLILRAVHLPAQVQAFRARRRQEGAQRALNEATRLLLEGRYGQALKQAVRAFEGGAAPGLAALQAARAAGGLRDAERQQLWLERAAEHDNGLRVARLMTEADLAVQGRRFEEAADRLESLRASGQRHGAALRLSLRTQQARAAWDEVLRLARQLEKHRGLTADEAAPIKRRAHLENLRKRAGDAVSLTSYWRDIPAPERLELKVAETAARQLIALGECGQAARLLEQRLDGEWDSGLAELYGRCRGGDVLARIAKAEGWLKAHPQDARLLLSLGRLCRQQQLWGKAQSYFEASLAVEPSRAAHAEVAQLLEELERREDAAGHFRAAAVLE